MHGNGERLRVVADRAAANGENKVNLRSAGDFDAFTQFLERRIGHHALDFGDVLPAALQNFDHLIVEARLLDGSTAVYNRHVGAVFGEFGVKVLKGLVAEIEFRRVAVCKVAEHVCLPRVFEMNR